MVGGDSSPSPRTGSKRTGAESEDEAPVRSAGGDGPIQDPGDREVPLKRDNGDPWEKNISQDLIAARLEGRKIETHLLSAAVFFESLYRIDRFRRFLPNRASDGRGLIQFWGLRARRRYKAEDLNNRPEWEIDGGRRLHTVAVGEIAKLR